MVFNIQFSKTNYNNWGNISKIRNQPKTLMQNKCKSFDYTAKSNKWILHQIVDLPKKLNNL